MKPKRLIAVQHADGRREYICKSCGQPMRHVETSDTSFSAGEVSETGEEYLFCDTCMTRSAYPAIPDFVFLNTTLDA